MKKYEEPIMELFDIDEIVTMDTSGINYETVSSGGGFGPIIG